MSDEDRELTPDEAKWKAIENLGCYTLIAIIVIVWFIASRV